MKIGLATYSFINKDIDFNLSQIQKAMQESDVDTDVLCFGEAFLQGFDVLSNVYEIDVKLAVTQDSAIMDRIKKWSLDYQVGVMFGYIEKDQNYLYSSYIFIDEGEIKHHYRRTSEGWKEKDKTDEHYKEGNNTSPFKYKGYHCNIALCGDGWCTPEKFVCENVLFWPVYVNFREEMWESEKYEYAKQAIKMCNKCVLVNSISKEPQAIGGAFYFENGEIRKESGYDIEDILYIEI